MDKLTKNRLTGAVIWLGALIWLVPQWYANPVNYPSMVFSGTKAAIDNLDDIDFDRLVSKPAVSELADQLDSPSAMPGSTPTTPKPAVNRPAPAPSPSSATLAEPAGVAITQPGFYVRLISYQNADSALRLEQQLKPHYPVSIGSFTTSSGRFYTVRVGPYNTRAQAERVKAILDVELRVESILLDRTNQ